MLEFQNPAAFFLFLLIPLLYLLRYLKIFRQITFSAVLADWNGKAFAWKGRVRRFLSILAKLIIFAGFVITIFLSIVIKKERMISVHIIFDSVIFYSFFQLL